MQKNRFLYTMKNLCSSAWVGAKPFWWWLGGYIVFNVICVISKKRSSLGQTFTKTKHKVKLMINQNMKFKREKQTLREAGFS